MTTSLSQSSEARFLCEVVTGLWPASGAVGETRSSYMVVLPSAKQPRILLPAGAPAAAATALRSGAEQQGRLQQLRIRSLAWLFHSQLGPMVFRDRCRTGPRESPDGINAALSTILGVPVEVGVRLGPARANRKPVLQVMSSSGALLAFAKLGINPLTDALVRTEAHALATLAAHPPSGVELPRVLHAAEWRGHALLVQSALPVHLARASAEADRQEQAMVSVSNALGRRRLALAESPFLRRLYDRVTELPAGPGRSALLEAFETAEAGSPTVFFGAWHGDWTTGNAATLDDRVLVWDWERFDADVPLGFDALHQFLLRSLTNLGRRPPDAVSAMIARAAQLLRPFEVRPELADLVSMLYLVELGARYLSDGQHNQGPAFGRLDGWLLPAVRTLSNRVAQRIA